ncbi:MAG: AGCS family alanine or glycine:cation symporter, partial [Patiriisocius sp.]
MKKFLLSLFTLITPLLTFAQEAQEMGMDQKIDKAFGDATGGFVSFIFYKIDFGSNIEVYWVLFPLILGALYFTVYFGFINFKGFFTSINIVRGKYDHLEGHDADALEVSDAVHKDAEGDNPDTIRVEGHDGEVSHFQALTAALSATVGLGNIAG